MLDFCRDFRPALVKGIFRKRKSLIKKSWEKKWKAGKLILITGTGADGTFRWPSTNRKKGDRKSGYQFPQTLEMSGKEEARTK